MKKTRAIFLTIVSMLLFSLVTGRAIYATGDGSPAECEDPDAKSEDNEDTLSHTAPAGTTISGVCIKSGTNMFGGASHSGLLGDGTYESGCYSVSGVGTGTVTVERVGEDSPTCQGLSHIDVFYSSATPTPTPTATPTETPTPTPAPTATPTVTPTASPAAAAGAVAGAAAESTPTPTPTPAAAVLGAAAEQLPETGAATQWFYFGLFTLLSGTGLTIFGLRKN